jgi:hypothetical protein
VPNAERLAEVLQPVFSGIETEVDTELVDRMVEAASSLAGESPIIVMTGGEQLQATYEGPNGMRQPA